MSLKTNTRTLDFQKGKNKNKYIRNVIKTSKYNIISFIPKCVFLQFTRLVNFYFLFTSIIMSIDRISPLGPQTAIAPLIFVLIVSLVREAIDEIVLSIYSYSYSYSYQNRQRNDKQINEMTTLKYIKGEYLPSKWHSLEVGDIVKVEKNQVLPADLIIYSTSDPNGICYIETSNLDGERNLKTKQSIQHISSQITTQQSIDDLQGIIEYELPNNRLYSFKGIASLPSTYLASTRVSLNNENLCLRSTALRNTEWIVGLIVYTGMETKIMMNKTNVRHKITGCEKCLNSFTLYIMGCNIGIIGVLAILGSYFYDRQKTFHWYIYSPSYLPDNESILIFTAIRFFSYFILLNTIIPISLIVSLDISKFFQSTMMQYDQQMNEPGQSFRCQNTLVGEDLGAIQYIFSDKTGTLTANSMEFKRCTIHTMDFHRDEMIQSCSSSSSLVQHMQLNYPDYQSQHFTEFFESILINNEVIYDPQEPQESQFQGSSPDEVSLVQFSFSLNMTFSFKTKDSICINIYDQLTEYKILEVLPFDADRKRMSVIVQNKETKGIRLYIKGADNMMFKIQEESEEQLQLYYQIKQRLKEYATDGLRTLVFGWKTLDEESYEEYQQKMETLKGQRHLRDTEQEENTLLLQLEQRVSLIGCTGVEDKLQEGVPETIQQLLDSQIKVIMLTGDKLETAENIGYSCNLLTKDTKVFRVKEDTGVEETNRVDRERERLQYIEYRMKEIQFRNYEATASQFNPNIYKRIVTQGNIGDTQSKGIQNIYSNQVSQWKGCKSEDHQQESQSNYKKYMANKRQCYDKYGLVLEGERIVFYMSHPVLSKMFIELMNKSRTLIVCRATPSQKSQILVFIKNTLNVKTLAIGDGGNDVNMIQAADIGVGIMGKEGNQAVMASDYCFGQFRHLNRLLLIHGRLALVRTTIFIYYFFYKNFLFTIQQVFFSWQNMFSSQSLWEDGYLLMFNTVTTAVAPLSFSIFEIDLDCFNSHSGDRLFTYLPAIYAFCRTNKQYSHKNMLKWLFMGLVQGLGVFYLTQILIQDQVVDQSGMVVSLYMYSTSCYSSTVLVTLLTLVFHTTNFTILQLFNYIGQTLVMLPLFVIIWDYISNTFIYQTAVHTYCNVYFVTLTLIVVSVQVLPFYLYSCYQFIYKPDLLQQTQQLSIKDKSVTNNLLKMFSFNKIQVDPINQNRDQASEYNKLDQKDQNENNLITNLSGLRINFGENQPRERVQQ